MSHTREPVQRYAAIQGMLPTVSGGDYVLYTDYAKLEAENTTIDLQLSGAACWTAEVEQRLADSEAKNAVLLKALKMIANDCDCLTLWAHVKKIADDALKAAGGV